MDWREELAGLRGVIDEVDAELMPLFQKRMAAARRIAEVKGKQNLAVQDNSRESQVIDNATKRVEDDLKGEAAMLMRTIMCLSREYQHRLLFSGASPMLPPPAVPASGEIVCAYQGVPGSWSEKATKQLYPMAETVAVEYFADIFTAVKNGKADYGIVPIENSKTGAIGETYDLLRRHGCYIVGRTWLSIRQNLVGLKEAEVSDVREVFSHPEGLKQCSSYLSSKQWEQTACRNTAVAAKLVADTGDVKKAAIASRHAAELYGLKVLAPDIMDAADNRTSFVVIARQPEYNEDSDLISLTFSTQHRSGALCEVLMSFMADNLNLMRIESRPIAADRYRFFAEIQGNIQDERVLSALRQAAAGSEYFEVLGCYSCVQGEEAL